MKRARFRNSVRNRQVWFQADGKDKLSSNEEWVIIRSKGPRLYKEPDSDLKSFWCIFCFFSYCNHLNNTHWYNIRAYIIDNLWQWCTYIRNHGISMLILIAHLGSPQKVHKAMRSAQVIHDEDPHGAIEALFHQMRCLTSEESSFHNKVPS